jgi:flagellar M-ring protein FliF
MWSDYWGALSSRQRTGLFVGAGLVAIGAVALTWWLLRDPYVALATDLSAEQRQDLARRLDVERIDYRVGAGGAAIEVPRSTLSEARVAAMGGQFDVPPSVGLELFKETDFSTTDFAQRINYQRALQGELTRTIQTIAGVRSARVHVILADPGVFKRATSKASAAVSLTLQAGQSLSPAQVRGIQRLVAASVPDMKIDDVVVLDELGASLTRPTGDAAGEPSAAQLDLKRQAEQYLEAKLSKLLHDIVPHGTISISVDALLDERQLRVTTEEPIGAGSSASVAVRGGRMERAAGVLVKERQLQRGSSSAFLPTGTDAAGGDAESVEQEYEYQVGRRTEQASSAPGSIRRISVAVALQGAPADLSGATVEQLVANAVGIDHTRGDAVTVLLMPAAADDVREDSIDASAIEPVQGVATREAVSSTEPVMASVRGLLIAGLVLLLLVLAAGALLRRRRSHSTSNVGDEHVDIDSVTAKVREWLSQGAGNGRT